MALALVSLQCVQDFITDPQNVQYQPGVSLWPREVTLSGLFAGHCFQAAVWDEFGTNVLGMQLRWESLDPTVAFVDASGCVTGTGNGQAIIAARGILDGRVLTGYATVTVAAPRTAPVGAFQRVTDLPASGHLNAVSGVFGFTVIHPQKLYAVGAGGTVLWMLDTGTWTSMAVGGGARLRAVWGGAQDNVYAVGDAGTIQHFDGIRWHADTVLSEGGRGAALMGVWGASPIDVIAVGSDGTILQRSREPNSHQWSADWGVTELGVPHLRAIWGSGDNAYAVGDAGTILHRTPYYIGNSHWIREASPTRAVLTGVWGAGADTVYASAADGSVLRRNPFGEWSVVARDSAASFTTVWGVSLREVYAAGTGGIVLRYDGQQWSRMAGVPPGATIRGLWATAAGEIYAVGDGGLMLRGRRGGAAGLAFASMPITDEWEAGAPFTVEVHVANAAGQLDASLTDTVRLALAPNAAGATLRGVTAVAIVNGVARFTALAVDRAGTGYTLTAMAPGLASATSPPFSITPDPTTMMVAVTPSAVTLRAIGATQQLVATASDAFNNVISGVTFTWTSTYPSVATVSASGLVTAVANGATLVTATTPGGVWGSTTVAVMASAPTRRFVSGDSHACSFAADGTADCWGADGSRQLDDGTTTNRTTPVLVGSAAAPAGWTSRVAPDVQARGVLLGLPLLWQLSDGRGSGSQPR